MADLLSQLPQYRILETECVLVHEMRQKCFPHVSRGAIKSQMRRLDLLTILAPRDLAIKLTQKYGKKKGGYYLTPIEHAHRLIETRAAIASQVDVLENAIPHTATSNNPTESNLPDLKHAESNLADDSLSDDFDITPMQSLPSSSHIPRQSVPSSSGIQKQSLPSSSDIPKQSLFQPSSSDIPKQSLFQPSSSDIPIQSPFQPSSSDIPIQSPFQPSSSDIPIKSVPSSSGIQKQSLPSSSDISKQSLFQPSSSDIPKQSLFQPSSSDIPKQSHFQHSAQLPLSSSTAILCSSSSPRKERIHDCNEGHSSKQDDDSNSERSMQASHCEMPSILEEAGDQELSSSDNSSPKQQSSHDHLLSPNPRKRKHGMKRSISIPITIAFPAKTKREVDDMLTFYSTAFNPLRSSSALSTASIAKLKQQVLVFLQFLVTKKKLLSPRLSSCFKIKLVKEFVDYLLKDIAMGHSTIKNYLASLKNAVSFLSARKKKYAKKVKENGILRRISNLYNQLQTRYKVQQRVFSDETTKFDWQDVFEVLRRMKNELQSFEGTKMEHARMLHNYVILLMYTSVAPGRNTEFMTMHLINGEAPQDAKNYIEYHDSGKIILKLRNYKTCKIYGPTVHNLETFPELTHAIERYMKIRNRLLCGHQHDFFFMRRSGEPFQESSQFSLYLKQNYKSFSDGIEFTTTSLRKALTNYGFASNKSPEELQAISRLMAHTDETHKKYYHTRRNDHLTKIGAVALSEDTARNLGFKRRNMSASATDVPCVDQIVALVSDASTAKKPDIWLAKVISVDLETKQAALAELIEEESNCYKFKIGSKYTEPFCSLISPVDVCYDESHNFYYLRSNKLDVHNFVEEQHRDSSGSSDNYV